MMINSNILVHSYLIRFTQILRCIPMYKLNICVCSYAFTQTFTYNSLITLPKHDVKDYARKLMRDTSNIVRLTEIKQLGKHREW